MLIALTLVAVCIAILLEKAARILLNTTTRLLLRQYYHHYHIETRANGTAVAVVHKVQSPALYGGGLALIAFLGLIYVLYRLGAYFLNALVSNRQSSERLPAAHPQDKAEGKSLASKLYSYLSVIWSPVQDDDLLDPELAPTSHSGLRRRYCPWSRSRNKLCPDIDTKFKDLFSACGQRSFTTFSQLFNSIPLENGDKIEKIADGKNSEIFRVHAHTGDSVLKVLKLDNTPESRDRLLHKIKIASRLSDLRNGQMHFTNGFVELKSVKCVFDSYPEELIKARDEETESLQNDVRGAKESEQTPRAYLVWHMSYAGVPLDQIELENALQLCSVLHQVARYLAVAEAALELEHRALWLRRVFVKRHALAEVNTRFTISGRSRVMVTRGVEVYIAGGASARLSDGDSPIFRAAENDFHKTVEPAVTSTNKNMEIIVRNDWRGFYPVTNLLWVHHVTRELRRRYEHKFDSSTDVAWSKIGDWEEQLCEYTSLAEFVEKQCDDDCTLETGAPMP